jgi:5-methylcytosine-specific restriction endonuclease McrA
MYHLSEVGDRDGWRCHLCREPVDRTLSGLAPLGPTIDHLIPLIDGGPDTFENVSLAHRVCNCGRGARGTVQMRLVG